MCKKCCCGGSSYQNWTAFHISKKISTVVFTLRLTGFGKTSINKKMLMHPATGKQSPAIETQQVKTSLKHFYVLFKSNLMAIMSKCLVTVRSKCIGGHCHLTGERKRHNKMFARSHSAKSGMKFRKKCTF